jgi:hypothetical protein
MKTLLILRYFIWSMLIFAFSMILLSVRGLRQLESRVLDFQSMRRYSQIFSSPVKVDVPFLSIPIFDQVSNEQYLEIARDIVHHLKKAGAKVVIVPIPQIGRPTEKVSESVQAIAADSIAIFAVYAWSNNQFRYGVEPPLDDRSHWWIAEPFFFRSEVPWGVMTVRTPNFNPLTRFAPTGFREFNTGAPVSDIAVVALKRFFDIPDNSELPHSPTSVHIGPSAFQTAKDGLSYIRARLYRENITEINVALAATSDSVQYFPGWRNRPYNPNTLEASWDAHPGKIVFIDWAGATDYRFFSYAWIYMQVFGAFFSGSFVSVHNEWNVLLITTLVLLLSVLSYTVRNGFMIFISLLLIVGSVVISIWLFDSHDVLFDPIYIIVPIFLCGAILPIVKVSGEKRLAEERIKSLEEENSRLQDFQRSAQAGTHT